MERQYDLFERGTEGLPRWVDAADDLKQARKKLERLAAASPSVEYFVHDFCSGAVVAIARPLGPPTRALSDPGSEERQEKFWAACGERHDSGARATYASRH